MTWRDLSDSELEARLDQRRCHPIAVEIMVRRREESYYDESITEILEGSRRRAAG